jgi:hypothetical protein
MTTGKTHFEIRAGRRDFLFMAIYLLMNFEAIQTADKAAEIMRAP